MTSKAATPEDSSKDNMNYEAAEDADDEIQYLKEIRKDTEKLKIDLEKKLNSILELEMEKQHKESKLSVLQNLLDTKLKEYITLDISKKADIVNETECKDKLKSARINRMASILEYKNEMAKLREQVFSPSDLDDSKINEEIEQLMASNEELNETSKMFQFEIDRMEKRTVPETEVNDLIDNMQLLSKQLKSETAKNRKLKEEMLIEMKLLDKKIQESIETN